jgi:hypothetical protein
MLIGAVSKSLKQATGSDRCDPQYLSYLGPAESSTLGWACCRATSRPTAVWQHGPPSIERRPALVRACIVRAPRPLCLLRRVLVERPTCGSEQSVELGKAKLPDAPPLCRRVSAAEQVNEKQ